MTNLSSHALWGASAFVDLKTIATGYLGPASLLFHSFIFHLRGAASVKPADSRRLIPRSMSFNNMKTLD